MHESEELAKFERDGYPTACQSARQLWLADRATFDVSRFR